MRGDDRVGVGSVQSLRPRDHDERRGEGAGESLLGLRRALHIAGARCARTSLSRVDDAATSLLMTDFYRTLWGTKATPSAALRAAQLVALVAHARRMARGSPAGGARSPSRAGDVNAAK